MEAHTPIYDRDKDHLNLLCIFHYITGGLSIAFSSICILYIVMGLVFYFNPGSFQPPNAPNPQPFPREFGLMMIAMGSCMTTLGWAFGILTIVSARKMKIHRARTFSLVIAGINCLWVPFGTILGVCTIIVLIRESVVRLYDTAAAPHLTQADSNPETP